MLKWDKSFINPQIMYARNLLTQLAIVAWPHFWDFLKKVELWINIELALTGYWWVKHFQSQNLNSIIIQKNCDWENLQIGWNHKPITNHNLGTQSSGTQNHGHESRVTQSPLNQGISMCTTLDLKWGHTN